MRSAPAASPRRSPSGLARSPARGSAARSPNTVGGSDRTPRGQPRTSPDPVPRPERRPESPASLREAPGPRRTSAPQGGGRAGPIPRRHQPEGGRRTAPQLRRGTVSASARATGGSVAAGRFPELPSVTPAGPTQPGTSTATAILPRPRP